MLFVGRQLLNDEIRRRLQEEQQKQQDGSQCGQDNETQIQELENNHNPE